MTISKIMDSSIKTVNENDTIRDSAIRMKELRLGAIIVGTQSKIDGIISERDIMRKVVSKGFSHEKPVKDFMSRNVITINVNADEDTALKLMEEKDVRHLPVVDDNGYCVGMLGIRDIMRAILARLRDENQSLTQYASTNKN